MKRRKLILGGLIFVLLFSLIPFALTRADDSNMTGSWNGKHGQVVLVGDSLFYSPLSPSPSQPNLLFLPFIKT